MKKFEKKRAAQSSAARSGKSSLSTPKLARSRNGKSSSLLLADASLASLSRQQLHDLYYYLRLNRRVDEQLSNLYRQGKVVGGVYSSLGQEAIAVGAAYALEPGDFVGPMIRDSGAVLVRGYRPRDLFLQYMARKDGPTEGRDANTHFGDVDRGVIAPISMLGELIPVLAGVALASKLRGEKRVALTFIGDGGTSTTPFHEGLNLAAVQKLALIVIAENNGWAYSTPVERQMANIHIADRGKGYGIAAESIDGNNVVEVYEATRHAVARGRAGDGPTLIEAKTMRMKGHAEHDDARYVPMEMLDAWRKRDPILVFEQMLASRSLMTEMEKSGIEARLEEEIRSDLAFAEASPFPPPEGAARSVWA
ncbi:MAG TPA: thiamine pyrophosphate-dependent dehydrogenase E1 component subunit alpha [Terriglobia bacterium]|nr:thiamine pyrophosphate-dependent dehydrogenase E1 component subunit alpha [Terriglobia bacterium]